MTINNNFIPTPLFQTEALKEVGLKNAWIKDESANPSGTIKDRRNEMIIKEASRLKIDKLVLITAGNNGYSLAKLAKGTNIKVVCIVNRDLDKKIIKILKNISYQVIEVNLSQKILRPEEIIAFARERDDEVIWDVTNGYEDAYIPLFGEIFSQLKKVDYIVVPLGSGGIYMGAIQAVERFRKETKVIGIGVQSTYHSSADKLSTPWTPYAKAIENYTKLGHPIFRLSEQEIKSFQKYQHLANLEPSSSVVFAAPEKFNFKKEDCVIFLNSG
jgi:cysteine synthase